MFPGDCLETTAYRDPAGYGSTWLDGRKIQAHRKAWIEAYGPIPDGMDVHHLCLNVACVFPGHLKLVPHDTHHLEHLSETCVKCGGSRWYTVMKRGKPSRRCLDCRIEANRRLRRK